MWKICARKMSPYSAWSTYSQVWPPMKRKKREKCYVFTLFFFLLTLHHPETCTQGVLKYGDTSTHRATIQPPNQIWCSFLWSTKKRTTRNAKNWDLHSSLNRKQKKFCWEAHHQNVNAKLGFSNPWCPQETRKKNGFFRPKISALKTLERE